MNRRLITRRPGYTLAHSRWRAGVSWQHWLVLLVWESFALVEEVVGSGLACPGTRLRAQCHKRLVVPEEAEGVLTVGAVGFVEVVEVVQDVVCRA